MSHTTVGRRLTALQRDLGVRLFDRTPLGLEPTPVAIQLAQDAERMERVACDIERTIAGNDSQLRGLVRITATEALGARFVAPHLPEFAATHPMVSVELISDLRPLSLARRQAELAIRLLPPDESTSVGTRVGAIAYAPYASTRAKSWGDDEGLPPLIGYSESLAGPETQWLVLRYPDARFVFRSNSTQALVATAVAGLGIAMLPVFVGDAELGLRRLASPSEVPPSELWIVAHRDTKPVPRVAALRRFLIDLCRREAAKLSGRGAG